LVRLLSSVKPKKLFFSEIHKILEQCKFAKFWEELQAEHDMIVEFAGFEEKIRIYICGVISNSFQRLRYQKTLSPRNKNITYKIIKITRNRKI